MQISFFYDIQKKKRQQGHPKLPVELKGKNAAVIIFY